MKFGSTKQNIILVFAMFLIVAAVGASLYYALHRQLDLTLVFAVAATCLSAVLWNYMSILELRFLLSQQQDTIQGLIHRAERALSNDGTHSMTAHLRSVRASLDAATPTFPETPSSDESIIDALNRARQAGRNGGSRSSLTASAAAETSPSLHDVADRDRKIANENSTVAIRRESRCHMDELRTDFAKALRRQGYSAAIAIGDEIVETYPDSVMAAHYLELRPYVLGHAEATMNLETSTNSKPSLAVTSAS